MAIFVLGSTEPFNPLADITHGSLPRACFNAIAPPTGANFIGNVAAGRARILQ